MKKIFFLIRTFFTKKKPLKIEDFLAEIGPNVEAHTLDELGWKYLLGEDMPQDPQKAFALFQRAADQGFANAQYALGLMYSCGYDKIVKRDLKEVIRLHQLAADQNHPNALHSLGWMHEVGCGVEQNLEKAAEFYERYRSAKGSQGDSTDVED